MTTTETELLSIHVHVPEILNKFVDSLRLCAAPNIVTFSKSSKLDSFYKNVTD